MITLHEFVSESGRCPVREEHDSRSETVQTNFNVAMAYLVNLPRADWGRPEVGKLGKQKKGYKGYYEIVFFADRVQHRPIGFFWPDEQNFVFLLWATEKGGELKPDDWRKIADKRRVAIESGTVCPQLLDLEDL